MSNAKPDAVRCTDVSVERHGHRVLSNVSFRVRVGSFTGVVGPNGGGKTTLLRAMMGLVPIATGTIEIFGTRVDAARGGVGEVGYVPQRHTVPASFPATVRDVVTMGQLGRRGPLARPSADDRREVALNLERVGLAELAERPVGRISGGEQRRAMLAQALCASQRLLVLDEPTVGLDLPAEQDFYALLARLRDELGLSVVAVSHDLLALAAAADALLCINRTLHMHGNPEEVVHSHALQEAYSCEFDFIKGELAHHERIGRGH